MKVHESEYSKFLICLRLCFPAEKYISSKSLRYRIRKARYFLYYLAVDRAHPCVYVTPFVVLNQFKTQSRIESNQDPGCVGEK